VEAETHTDLVVGDQILMSVLNADAQPLGKSRSVVSRQHAARLATALELAAKRTTLKALLLGVLFTLLATAALVALLKVSRLLFPRFIKLLEAWRTTVIPAIRIQRLEFVSASRVTDFLLGVVEMARLAVIVLLLYVYIPLVLSFFPWTAPLADRIIGYVATPLKNVGVAVVGYLPNIFFIAVIVVITRYALKFIHLLFDAVARGAVVFPGFYREWSEPTYKIVRFMVLAFVVVVVFPYLPGAQSDAFKGVSLFLGALFTLGSSSAIANVVAGTVLTFTRAFQIGDRIKIGDTAGDVLERTLLVTRVRTVKNVDVTIPNAQVLSSHIINYSTVADTGGIALHSTVTIGYDVPWRRVHELLLAAARATEGVVETPAPFVLQTSLDDFAVSYQVNAYTDQPRTMVATYSLLHESIQDRFNEAGIEIMSPHYAAVRDGNATTVPPEHRPKDYRAPGFHIAGPARPV
jgi:small-conductance mechanosensitive channel